MLAPGLTRYRRAWGCVKKGRNGTNFGGTRRFCCKKAPTTSALSLCQWILRSSCVSAAVAFRKLLGWHKPDKEPRRMVYTWYTTQTCLVCRRPAMCVKGQPHIFPSSPFGGGVVPSYRYRPSEKEGRLYAIVFGCLSSS